ncbi:Gluconokinase [Cystobacter fuscus DSM 2262]|uniref:Gluconokinase n=1 Tax=Cystobacter fuscus (strain ATCC 25194 / DSM 2262 / NBRC 100088 / M29) TaxID=1242864 RepID=S9QTR6_CYSF2|nr:gluconokinase [Cystobacter fuscus]EPX60043.1 Gluconokinase [Cystobacter fuscus DSM 2262]
MVVIVMGVAGAGKTTVGTRLARVLGWSFRDADEFHSAESIAKMAAGGALTDAERAPWLERMRQVVQRALESGEGLVLACSALKSAYRERLTVEPARQRWVYLHASREVLAQRLSSRRDHFMPPSQLDNQLAVLEEPEGVCSVEVSVPPDEVVARVLRGLGLQPSV